MEWFIWSLVSVFTWGLWGLLLKVALQGLVWQQLLLFSAATSLVISLGVAAIARPSLALPPETIAPAIAAAVLGNLGGITLYLALASGGRASVVIPLTAAYPVITAALSIAVLREGVDATKIAAVALFVLATFLAAR